MNLTQEQSALLGSALARPDLILATAANSPNDVVWMDLVEKGVLEMVEPETVDPKDSAWIHLACRLNLRCYRVTKRAADFGAKLDPVTAAEVYRTVGNA